MSESYVKKNGLLYSEDMSIVYGVDTSSTEFTGRVPYGAKIINDEAFSGCDYESISLPDSVQELGSCVFENSSKLKTVKLPGNLSVLPPYLFSGCTALTKVTLPTTLTSIPEGLFYSCSSMEEIPFRAGIQEIPENAIAACSSLKTLVVPNTVTKIASKAVSNCEKLEAVVLSAHLYELAEDAFEACPNIHSIRIDGDNHLFYVSEEDGCLYEKSIEGEDKCRLRISKQTGQDVKFFEENLNEEVSEAEIAENEEFEEDDTFSSDIGAVENELAAMGLNTDSEINESSEIKKESGSLEDNMSDTNDVDAMLKDIMGEEQTRTASVEVAISQEETQVLSQVMDAMSSSSVNSTSSISTDELEKLFENNEASEAAGVDEPIVSSSDLASLDGKTQILADSVGYSNVLVCDSDVEAPDDFDLFVIAEKTGMDETGTPIFSSKLEKCCKTIARIRGFRRVIMLYGLPTENPEFEQFFYHFMSMRNVIFAAEASNPASLSDYGKYICEQTRISLDKEQLNEQRRQLTIKNDSLIKIILQDIYD